MAGRDIVVIGASAGGIEALTRLVRELPSDLAAALFVVVHFPAHATSALPRILERAGTLPAHHARDGETIESGWIYVAPPDHHLLIKQGHVHVLRGPRENGHRPAVDPLFRSAARAYGRRVVAVVLSGTLDDGAAGVVSVRARGGTVLVQDPEDALYAGMPNSAMAHTDPDQVLSAPGIAEILPALAHTAAPGAEEETMTDQPDITELYMQGYQTPDGDGTATGFTCPDCHGALWDVPEDGPVRFRCRVGHAFSADALLDAQGDALESALWTAVVTLKERAALSRRLSAKMGDRQQDFAARRLAAQAADMDQHAATIRGVLTAGGREQARAVLD